MANVAPHVTITQHAANSVFQIGSPVTVHAPFTDPGSNDSQTCTIDWGDRATTAGAVAAEHKLVLVIVGGCTDPDGNTVSMRITGVTQAEALNGLGDGDTSPDAQAAANPWQVWLRAERSGTGDGRVYRIAFTATDGHGGTTSGVVTVGVPHDNNGAAVDTTSVSVDSFG